jgi:2-polyprenyl-3-methyl-5-hydroxy-6-metoxy-1,4-benzoquinol methylase
MVNTLIELYKSTSKHSNYQILPEILRKHIGDQFKQTISRYEKERMVYVKKYVSFQGKQVADIGGNTGYFSFEAIDSGASNVNYFEGNQVHAKFVETASSFLKLPIHVNNEYVDFKENLNGSPFDILLLFNVIHHLGDDFGDQSIDIEEAKREMQAAIRFFHTKTKTLVLQLGYCWKGNRNFLLFAEGTKKEMIEFVQEAIFELFTIEHIGIPSLIDGETIYQDENEYNIIRNDNLGEFRNRPIFILKSNYFI